MNEIRKRSLKINRSHVLETLRRYKDGCQSKESVSADLLEIRYRFLLPWMTDAFHQEGHPYATLVSRIIRAATILMGEEWVENFMEKQQKSRR